MQSNRILFLVLALFVLPTFLAPVGAVAQPIASVGHADELPAEIESISVTGVDDERLKNFLLNASGLRKGQRVVLPNDPAFAVAIRAIYRLDQFSHVEIRKAEAVAGLHVEIHVVPYPKLDRYHFTGISPKEEKHLRRLLPLHFAATVRPADIDRARWTIKKELKEKGYHLAEVQAIETPKDDGTVDIEFNITTGPVVRVKNISIEGNEQISDRDIKRAMDTAPRTWWKFWDKGRFDQDQFVLDQERVLAFLHEKGFYDARVLGDSVWLDTDADKPALHVQLELFEGPRYTINTVAWEGNTLFSDEELTTWLDVEPGDAYNLKKLEENLYGKGGHRDVSSRYMNLGYMRFAVQPTITVVAGDKLDLAFEVTEGEPYVFGDIEITGNHTTNDHVVRRELYSIPGEQFSRAAIQESIRRLMQSGHVSQQTLRQGPGVIVDDENKRVNLRYDIEEANFPRPQITGSVGQFGLVLGVNMVYNNFSLQKALEKGAWRPLPSGDGQQIGLNVQANGANYQHYGFNFTEPWFRGKPAPLGFDVSFTRIAGEAVASDLSGTFNTFSTRLFHDRRLSWPSPFFDTGTSIEYRSFENSIYEDLPQGKNQQLSLTQFISHNTTNHPVFASRGVHHRLSAEVGLPVDGFVQYHKWRFQSSWNVPLTRNGRLSLNAGTELGYIGALNGQPVNFERFVLGGSPLDAQGLGTTPILGTDVVYLRGYPLGAFEDPAQEDVTGARFLTKYTSEFRWMAVQQPQLQLMPYAFFDAANTWNEAEDVSVRGLFRSAGFGIRAQVPMLGLLEVVYGRNLDRYVPPAGSSSSGASSWGLQFSIGRKFNF